MSPMRLLILTLLALVGFAANSVLARAALGPALIDPASYTTIRLVSGAVALWLIVILGPKQQPNACRGSWGGATLLFLYAITLSFAYIALDTGIGALILFALVQITMIGSGLFHGERPHPGQWLGVAAAVAGLAWMVWPGGAAAPPLWAAALMALSGIAWGLYSLRGRGSRDPVAVTADNFLRAVPMTLAASLLFLPLLHLQPAGVLLAVASGAVSSGVGYAVWYAALPALSAIRAASVQLAAPVLAAIAGVLLMAEPVTLRLVTGGALIIGGIAATVLIRERVRQPPAGPGQAPGSRPPGNR